MKESKTVENQGLQVVTPKTTLDLFKECRDKTRLIMLDTEANDTYEGVIDAALNEFQKCSDLGNVAAKEAIGTPTESHVKEAIESTQSRLQAEGQILKQLKELKSGEGNMEAQSQLEQLNFAIGFIKQKEVLEWQELSIRSTGSINSYDFFNTILIGMGIVIFLRFIFKNKAKKQS